jgi:porin
VDVSGIEASSGRRRPKDKFGIAAAYAHFSRLCARPRFPETAAAPPAGAQFEGLIAAIYQYEVRAGWTPSQTFSLSCTLGGRGTNPLSSDKALKSADVIVPKF